MKEKYPYKLGEPGLADVSSRRPLPAGLLAQTEPLAHQLATLDHFLLQKKVIDTRDLLEVLMAERSIGRIQAHKLLEQVIIFLWLSTIRPANTFVTPSNGIDAAWKLFILQTSAYRRFQQLAGFTFDRIEQTTLTNARLANSKPWMSNHNDVCAFLGSRIVRHWWIVDTEI